MVNVSTRKVYGWEACTREGKGGQLSKEIAGRKELARLKSTSIRSRKGEQATKRFMARGTEGRRSKTQSAIKKKKRKNQNLRWGKEKAANGSEKKEGRGGTSRKSAHCRRNSCRGFIARRGDSSFVKGGSKKETKNKERTGGNLNSHKQRTKKRTQVGIKT